MSDDRRLERSARAWLELGPTSAPDHVVETALATIESTSQERDLGIPWRLPKMTPITRLAGAAAVGILAVGISLFALRPASNVGVTPPPSPTASASGISAASDSSAALAAYRSARNAVCDAIFASPIPDPGASANPSASIAFLQATVLRETDEANQLEAIQAPPSVAAEHLANIQTLRDVIALLNHEIDLLRANKTAEAATVDDATASLNTLREQFAAKYALKDCP